MALRHTLVIVEDSQDDEELALRSIKASGITCTVQVIRHGAEALTTLRARDASVPDLIVLDFHLPGYNGIEILQELRQIERFRHVPIVMVSSLASERQISECLNSGATSFVQKSMDSEIYAERVMLIVRYWLTVDQRSLLGS
jgi:two-component system, response regulator